MFIFSFRSSSSGYGGGCDNGRGRKSSNCCSGHGGSSPPPPNSPAFLAAAAAAPDEEEDVRPNFTENDFLLGGTTDDDGVDPKKGSNGRANSIHMLEPEEIGETEKSTTNGAAGKERQLTDARCFDKDEAFKNGTLRKVHNASL